MNDMKSNNPRTSGLVGGSSLNSDFFFCSFVFFVSFFVVVHVGVHVGGWGLANPCFSRIAT